MSIWLMCGSEEQAASVARERADEEARGAVPTDSAHRPSCTCRACRERRAEAGEPEPALGSARRVGGGARGEELRLAALRVT